MELTSSNGWATSDHTSISKWQLSSDVLIAVAYFSIPLELLYFIYRSQVFPFRWVIAQFGLFIVLCGTTHLLTLWNYVSNSTSSHICMTIAKVTTAVISCGTAVVLLRVIPDVLDVKKRELFLTAKVCANVGATIVPSGSGLARLGCSSAFENDTGHVAAVRLPLLSTASFNCSPKIEETTLFAIMVLEPPRNGTLHWSKHELQLIEAVADQVVVALSHATVLEESIQARDLLLEQNIALESAKREAELAVVARNEFLAVMNHEMRTPMHAIIALSSLLLESGLSVEQISMIETIKKSSSILSLLINDVLDFTRLEAGSLHLDLQAFQLPTLLKEAEELVTPMAQAKNLPLSMSVRGDIPRTVYADNNRILQVFLNVVGNSIKFTREGYIKIYVHLEDGDNSMMPNELTSLRQKVTHKFLHFEVEDTGIGIKGTDLPRLFNKFVQADSSTTRNFGGSGLGLAISRKFVELMGGKIWLASQGLGKGSVCKFYVSLGIVEEVVTRPPMSTSPKKPLIGSDLPGLKVLVVDDNAINRIVTRRLMETIGCKTTVTDSGKKCLESLMTAGPGAYNVLLLDLCMPEMDGFDVATEIRKRFESEERPLIVALTANSDEKTRQRCFDVGMDAVLTKPISIDNIRLELSKLIESLKGH